MSTHKVDHGKLRSLVALCWAYRVWWMVPMVLVLVGLTGLILLAKNSALTPFTYGKF